MTMQLSSQQQLKAYEKNGYFVIKDYFTQDEMTSLREVILTFHNAWKKDNKEFFEEVAFNSSLITGSEYLKGVDRVKLFNFISCEKLMTIIRNLIPNKPSFMNTQLFFNPINPKLKDFWHRDCQYDHGIEEQKKAILETQVVHFRVPLFDELGMELVPGTHKRWDSQEEHDVRQECNGKFSNDDLSTGKKIPLNAGDLLVFSADMIHRGLYGLNRLAFDILVFDESANFIDYVDPDCLPNQRLLDEIKNPELFRNTLQLLKEL